MRIILLKKEDIKRVTILEKRKRSEITQRAAAVLLGLCPRHVRRLERTYKAKGACGLVHGNRGKSSSSKLDPASRNKILLLLESSYVGIEATLVTELLKEEQKIKVSVQTVWRLMGEVGLRKKRYLKRKQQLDGSEHDWFEGRAPRATLLKFIDDATGKVTGLELVPFE